jgi:hypothetical protein
MLFQKPEDRDSRVQEIERKWKFLAQCKTKGRGNFVSGNLFSSAGKSIPSSFLVMFPTFKDPNYFLLPYVKNLYNNFPLSFPISLKYYFHFH